MTWTEVFAIFTRPLFQLGQTWISLATIAEFIVVTTASTLHAHGVTTIQTAAEAAEALRAVAGRFTFVVFALGIIGTGLLTLPVLSASAAYTVGELMSWRVGLGHQSGRAKAFYGAIAVATVVGGALNFTPTTIP